MRVRGDSMLATLADGDVVLVRPTSGVPTSRWPGRLAIVRLPGDRPVAVKRITRAVDDGWWVERDNPQVGIDSWVVGAVPTPEVLGLVVARIWPRPGLTI
jgi:SOS-response transcriptional repressor LexA